MPEHPLLYVGIFAVVIFVGVVLLSLLIGVCVAVAGRIVSDRNAQRYQTELRQMLPGRNCGQCGCENCDAYARAVYYGAAAENACPYGDEALPEQMIECVNRLHAQMEDPTPPKPKNERILGIWDKKQ